MSCCFGFYDNHIYAFFNSNYFAIAKFYGKEIVEIADLIEAVIDNERLYEFSKIRITKALEHLKCFDQENIKKTKIIKLNSKF